MSNSGVDSGVRYILTGIALIGGLFLYNYRNASKAAAAAAATSAKV